MIERGFSAWAGGAERSMEERLRGQMQADALDPLGDGDGEDLPKKADLGEAFLLPEIVEEAAQFLCMNVSTSWLNLSSPSPQFASFVCSSGVD